MINRLRFLTTGLVGGTEETIQKYRNKLSQLIDRRFFLDPHQITQIPFQRLDELLQRLVRAIDQTLTFKKERLTQTWKNLIYNSPKTNLLHLKRLVVDLNHRLFCSMENGLKIKQESLKFTLRTLLQNSLENWIPHWKERQSVLEKRATLHSMFSIHHPN